MISNWITCNYFQYMEQCALFRKDNFFCFSQITWTLRACSEAIYALSDRNRESWIRNKIYKILHEP
jgi:hypothetical protein